MQRSVATWQKILIRNANLNITTIGIKMTDSNIQPPDTTNDQTVNIDSSNSYDPTTAGAIPGTDVTYTTPAGLYPEGDDGTIGLSDPNQDVVITTGTAADTYTVDPYAGAVDFQVDNMVTSTPDPLSLIHISEPTRPY